MVYILQVIGSLMLAQSGKGNHLGQIQTCSRRSILHTEDAAFWSDVLWCNNGFAKNT